MKAEISLAYRRVDTAEAVILLKPLDTVILPSHLVPDTIIKTQEAFSISDRYEYPYNVSQRLRGHL